MKTHAILALVNVGVALAFFGCGSAEEKYTAYEITPTESLTSDEALALTDGCTRIVQNLGTFSTKDDCNTHIAGVTRTDGKVYQCEKKDTKVACK